MELNSIGPISKRLSTQQNLIRILTLKKFVAHNYSSIKTSLIILLLTRSVQSIKSRKVAVDFLKLGDIVNALSTLGLRWLAVQLVSILIIATSFYL